MHTGKFHHAYHARRIKTAHNRNRKAAPSTRLTCGFFFLLLVPGYIIQALWHVALARPVCLPIAPHESPRSRKARISLPSTIARGRPSTLPCLRARSSPALVRSESRTRSCFATTARMEMTASRNMPVLSRYCSVNERHCCHPTRWLYILTH